MIIYYGGCFDPPHHGHVHCIKRSLAKFPQAKVLVAPVMQAPPVKGVIKHHGKPFLQRLAECKQFFGSQAFTQQVTVTAIENNFSRPNYSWQVLTYLHRRYAPTEIYVLLGDDQLEHFSSWQQANKIIQVCSLIFVRRQATSFAQMQLWLQTMSKSLNQSLRQTRPNCYLFTGGSQKQVWLLDATPVTCSSSALRLLRTKELRNETNSMDNVIKKVIETLKAKQADDVRLYDLKKIPAICEYQLVVSALNTKHAQSLVDEIRYVLKSELSMIANGVDGYNLGAWIALDYGHFLLHIFSQETRNCYAIDSIWQEYQVQVD